MSIENLRKLVTPPEKPLFPGSPAQWQHIEQELNIRFPSDYKEYVSVYGQGLIDDDLQIFNPFTTRKHCRLRFDPDSEAGRLLNVLADRRRGELAKKFPFPPYPEKDGLLPIGESENAVLYWMVKGPADKWPIVVEVLGPFSHTVSEESLTSFLCKLITREITIYNLPRFPHSVPASFVQYGDP